MKLDTNDIKELEKIREKAGRQIQIIDERLSSDSKKISDSKISDNDTATIERLKRSYIPSLNQKDQILLAMRKIANDILIPNCDRILQSNFVEDKSELNITWEEFLALEDEIKTASKTNREYYLKYASLAKITTEEESVLAKQSDVEERLDRLLEKNHLPEKAIIKDILPNLSLVKIPEEQIKGKIISIRYEEGNARLNINFQVVNFDSQQNLISLFPIVESAKKMDGVVHTYYTNTLMPHILKNYENISFAMFEQSVKDRIRHSRIMTQKWLLMYKEKLSQKFNEDNLSLLLSLYGVFTEQEIKGMVKSTLATRHLNISLQPGQDDTFKNEINKKIEELQNKLRKFAEIGKPPIDYEKEFNLPIKNLIDNVDRSNLTLADKISFLNSIYGLIQRMMSDIEKEHFDANREIWIQNLENAIKIIGGDYIQKKKLASREFSTPQSVLALNPAYQPNVIDAKNRFTQRQNQQVQNLRQRRVA